MVNFAVIGWGKMGKIYDHLLGAQYLVDLRPIPGRVYFPNTDELIAYRPKVDLVIVATWSNSHYEIAKKLLTSGYNVLVEKPICLSSQEAEELEVLAQGNNLILYQSSLERYNPVIKFFKEVSLSQIKKIESFRFGLKPERAYVEEAKFDLGVHDVDLWFYLTKKSVPWRANVGWNKTPRREILLYFRDGRVLNLDLLNKQISFNDRSFFSGNLNSSNPILETIDALLNRKSKMNEKWSEEIAVIEQANDEVINLVG